MDTIRRRTTPPDESGIYWFQDAEIVRKWGEQAFYICIVVKVREETRGLFADFNRNQQIQIEDGELIAHFNFPSHRHEPIVNLDGTWWGPLPNPDL